MTGGTDKGDKMASTEILSMSISADILQFFFDPTSNQWQWVETGQLKKNCTHSVMDRFSIGRELPVYFFERKGK